MTVLSSPKSIVFNPETRDYDASYDDNYLGSFSTWHRAEVALNDYVLILCEQGLIDAPLATLAEQSLRAACELPSELPSELDGDPFADPRTDEEIQWETEGWTEVNGGWEKFGPHPFDPSKTVRHFRARLFSADTTPLPEPDDIPGADPAPGRCRSCNDAIPLGPVVCSACREQGYCAVCGDNHPAWRCPEVAAARRELWPPDRHYTALQRAAATILPQAQPDDEEQRLRWLANEAFLACAVLNRLIDTLVIARDRHDILSDTLARSLCNRLYRIHSKAHNRYMRRNAALLAFLSAHRCVGSSGACAITGTHEVDGAWYCDRHHAELLSDLAADAAARAWSQQLLHELTAAQEA